MKPLWVAYYTSTDYDGSDSCDVCIYRDRKDVQERVNDLNKQGGTEYGKWIVNCMFLVTYGQEEEAETAWQANQPD